MRLLEGEAFPLSTKERCPYLVFCEVTEDAGAEHAKARRVTVRVSYHPNAQTLTP